MTNTELALNMLAEAATTELSKQLESDLGHSVISPLNARTGLRLKDKNDKE